MGGNYIKQPKGLTDKTHEATIGDTKLTVKAVKTEYLVAGSKANNTGKGSIVNGNTTLVIEDGIIQYEADPSKGAVVGGNYIKASSPSAGMVSQTNSTVGDTSVTINGGTFGGSVYGSSFAENYAHVDTPDMQLKLTTGNSSLQINGGTYNGHVVAGSGVTGQGTSSTAQSAAVTINAAKNKTVTLGNNSILIGGDYLANRGKSEIEGNTSVTVTGEGTITLGKGIVGGSYVAENKRGTGGKYTASEIKGTTNILVDAANVTVKDEVIGGTYLRQTVQDTDKDSFVSATVGSTNLILKAGTFKSNVIAGGKSNDFTGSLSNDVLGDTSLTITGGTYEAAVLGGGSAKAGQGDASNKRDVSADVMGTARVNVTGGTLNGIVGGGLSYLYTSSALTDAVVTTHVENVAANITGGTINTMDHNSGLDDFGIPASVVGGRRGIFQEYGNHQQGGSHRWKRRHDDRRQGRQALRRHLRRRLCPWRQDCCLRQQHPSHDRRRHARCCGLSSQRLCRRLRRTGRDLHGQDLRGDDRQLEDLRQRLRRRQQGRRTEQRHGRKLRHHA